MTLPIKLFLSLSVLCTFANGDEDFNHVCPCVYETHPDGESECRVFGQLGKVIPWYRAMDKCTDALGLGIRPYNTDWLWQTCPHLNGTDANVDAIVNLIRKNEAPFAEEIRFILVQKAFF